MTMTVTFQVVPMSDGQDRHVVLIDGEVVCRAPSLRQNTERKTTPGSVVWVLSESSKSLRRLERQLRDGSRILRPAVPEKIEESVRTSCSYISEEELAALTEERAGVAKAIEERAQLRKAKSKKSVKAPAKTAKPQMSFDQMRAMARRIVELEGENAKLRGEG